MTNIFYCFQVETCRGIQWFLCVKIHYVKYKIDPDKDEDTTLVVYRHTKHLTAPSH